MTAPLCTDLESRLQEDLSLADAYAAMREAASEIRRLRLALEHYTHCRHACQNCFCTKEARNAL